MPLVSSSGLSCARERGEKRNKAAANSKPNGLIPTRLFMAVLPTVCELHFPPGTISSPPQNASPSSSSIQQTVEVRSMDFHVAIHARLFIVRLVRIHHRRVNARRIGMALQAQEIDVAVLQHVRICPPVCDMA